MSEESRPPSPPDGRSSAGRRRGWLLLAFLLSGAALGLGYLWWRSRGDVDVPSRPAPARPSSARQPASAPSQSLGGAPGMRSESMAGGARGDEPLGEDAADGSLQDQKAALLTRLEQRLGVSGTALARVRAIFESSSWLSQGNPKVTRHPMTRTECEQRRAAAAPLPAGDPRCGALNMVPLFNPRAGETAAQARVCIDQYEFPNIACDYPVIWVRANEAVELCRALDKRICDAHEWEGACAGALLPPEAEYAFGERRLMIEYLHNKEREITWSYGAKQDQTKCATGSSKSATCTQIDWGICGSNTYPSGAFPACRSPLGAFDLNGNAAEHMNLPLQPEQLASRGGLGETEMKGSWFIFSSMQAHPDDCRWRAPMWHKSRIDEASSHRNYHLGFRCCRDIEPAKL